MYRVRCCILAAVVFPAVAMSATRLDPGDVAEPLQPWVEWVLSRHPEAGCPFLFNNLKDRRCAWPGRLDLEIDAGGASFGQDWTVFADSWLTVPGDLEAWPQDVRVDGSAVAVVERRGRAVLHVTPGRHRIEGRIRWKRMPESVTVPADSGLVSLRVLGREIRQPEIDRGGRVWLRDPDRAAAAQDGRDRNQLTLTVVRRIVDDNPLEIHTRIDLDVAGDQREQTLGVPLPPGFVPVSIAGAVPARLEADGVLTAQLRPGRHQITVRGRHPEPATTIANAAQPAPWPATETWVFDPRNHIRVVEVEGVPSVDPRQTRVPDDWRHLPAFTVSKDDEMKLVVSRRGDPDPEPDKLSLARELWLDFDGGGYTAHDAITGEVTRTWRIDSGPRLHLGQVIVDGQPQFITRLADGTPAGVEVRRGRVDLRADGRMDAPVDGFPAAGWAHDFQRVSATLRLPPGWDVFAVRGVDNVPNTWLSRWTLLDLFLVLVIAASVSRLWHWQGAGVALIAMTLIWHAPDAPRFVWIHLLVAIALLRVLPDGRFRSLAITYRNVTALALVLIAIPFVVQQLRVAMYPQLAQPGYHAPQPPAAPRVSERAPEPAAMAADDAAEEMLLGDEFQEFMIVEQASVASSKKTAPAVGGSAGPGLYGSDPDAVVQTGPGLPSWQWRELHLDWNGPVDQGQELAIRYIPPGANAALNVARVLLLLAMLVVVSGTSRAHLRAMAGRAGLPLLVFAVVLGSTSSPGVSAAGFPQPELLEELEQRLLAPPECGPQCAGVARMRLDISQADLTLRLEVHASAVTAIPLPGSARAWLPERVLVNGSPARGIARLRNGSLWLQVEAGVHDVVLQGSLPPRDSAQIALPLRPRFTEIGAADGWRIAGLRDDGLVEAQLQLTRIDGASAPPRADRFEKTPLPPFIRVERTIALGLDWSVTTRVVRVVGGDSAVVLDVPLLDGESVVTPGVDTGDGVVHVNLPHNQTQVSWQSLLDRRDSIELTAPASTDFSETWRLQAGPIWHASLSGIAPVHHRGEGDRWLPEWRPWPGETVTIVVTRPQGIGGQTVTIDASTLQVRPGKRATEASLDVSLRSSKGGQYTLGLPPSAQLQQVTINGIPQPIRSESDRLTLPISPGAQQVSVTWRDRAGITSRFTTPTVDLGIASINHEIRLSLGRDRWTLFAFGPRLGPAVLFWSLLAALLITAVGLSRASMTPLKLHEWLLLVIGLSQLFLPLAAVVVLWLFALGGRAQYGARFAGAKFNLMQIALALLTIGALLVFVEAIRRGLLGHPNMHVAGNGSSAHALTWYADRVGPAPPAATAVTVPLLVYRVLMLAWALWLALAIVRWLRWGWSCFAAGGLWQAWRKPRAPDPQPAPPAT